MTDLGDMMARALATQIVIIAVIVAIVFGGIGWAIGHFLF